MPTWTRPRGGVNLLYPAEAPFAESLALPRGFPPRGPHPLAADNYLRAPAFASSAVARRSLRPGRRWRDPGAVLPPRTRGLAGNPFLPRLASRVLAIAAPARHDLAPRDTAPPEQ